MALTDRIPVSGAEAVYAQLTAGSPGEHDEPAEFLDRRPVLDGEATLSEWELDLRDWVMAFGMAWMLYPAEDPFASVKDIGERAFGDGWAALARWGDRFNHERPAALG